MMIWMPIATAVGRAATTAMIGLDVAEAKMTGTLAAQLREATTQ
jgi:hypothetical protein